MAIRLLKIKDCMADFVCMMGCNNKRWQTLWAHRWPSASRWSHPADGWAACDGGRGETPPADEGLSGSGETVCIKKMLTDDGEPRFLLPIHLTLKKIGPAILFIFEQLKLRVSFSYNLWGLKE